jgi:hypothetical protein
MTDEGRDGDTRRFLIEGIVIVISILAAFALESWWGERQERQEERVILAGLQQDFGSARAALETRLESHVRIAHAVTTTLEVIEGAYLRGEPTAVVVDTTIGLTFIPPTTQLSLGTLDGLLQSGRLGVLRDTDLRAALSAWPHVLAELTEEEVTGREFVVTHLDPVLRARVNVAPFRSAGAALFDGIASEAMIRGTSRIPADTETIGVFATRHQIQDHLVDEFAPIFAEIDRILGLIERSLD